MCIQGNTNTAREYRPIPSVRCAGARVRFEGVREASPARSPFDSLIDVDQKGLQKTHPTSESYGIQPVRSLGIASRSSIPFVSRKTPRLQ